MTFGRLARPAGVVTGLLLLTSCAETNAPALEPQEVLLAVNSTAATLSIMPVDAPASIVEVPLGGTTPTPVGVSARDTIAIVPLGLDNAVAVVSLRSARVTRTIPLPAGSGATGSVVVDDSIAYVANPGLNSISRVNYRNGATREVPVGVYPQGIVYSRGKLFVLNGNLDSNFSPAGPSWLTVVDPVTNTIADGVDSIPLTGPGNAGFAAESGDGTLYVLSTGSFFEGEGRLSAVDPVARRETASFAGFGTGPGGLASDGASRLYVSSFAEGLMVFDSDSNVVVRGAGEGVRIPGGNSAVAVDSQDRVYALEAGSCSGGRPGSARVLRPADLSEVRTIALGECPSGAAIAEIPQMPQE